VRRWHWANVGTRVWGQNLRSGFVWDDDCFLDNQLAHPYQGSLYLNSARASGYGFWGSLPFVAAGSVSWELFLENVRPSLNDVVNTTLGGMALGEVTFRLSSLLGSKRAAKSGLMPVATSSRRAGSIAAGRHAGRLFVILGYEYGSPFDPAATKPYDAFETSLQVGPTPEGWVRRVGVSGLLARTDLRRSERTQVVLGLYQHYDYVDLPRIESGGQSLSGALLIQRRIGSRTQLRFGAHTEALLLGAISSDQGQYFRRDYDYGSGAGARLSSALALDGRDLLRFDGRVLWLHSLHGARADHMLTQVRLAAALHLGGLGALGGDVGVTARHSWYREGSAVTRRAPEARVYLVWPPL
jgi:hypothetical protein